MFRRHTRALLISAQNLSTAILTAVGYMIGDIVTGLDGENLDHNALHAIWWLSLVIALGALICLVFVRVPGSEEKEHGS